MFTEMIHNFIIHHDPDRFSHIKVKVEVGNYTRFDSECTGIFITPTRHFTGSKFEIINTKRKIREFDKVVFYLKILYIQEAYKPTLKSIVK